MERNSMYENENYLIEENLAYSYIKIRKKTADVYLLEDKNLVEIFKNIIESTKDHIYGMANK